MPAKPCVCGCAKADHRFGRRGDGTGSCRNCETTERFCGRYRVTERCAGSGKFAARTQGGASWMNFSHCPICGKKVTVTRLSRLRSHPAKRVS